MKTLSRKKTSIYLLKTLVRLATLFIIIKIISFGSPLQAHVIEIFDPSWEKTSNASVEGPQQGTTIYPIDDPYWQWTTTVWDGPSPNPLEPSSTTYPGFVPGDYWALWEHIGEDYSDEITHLWFKTSIDIYNTSLLNEVRLINKYSETGIELLTINDSLYVWVNELPAAAGGTASSTNPPVNRIDRVVEPFRSMYVTATASGTNMLPSPYTGWYIDGGLVLPTELFQAGSNEIYILAEDHAGWGGLGHPVFKTTQADSNPIPEPSTYLLLGSGIIGLAWFRRKFRKR